MGKYGLLRQILLERLVVSEQDFVVSEPIDIELLRSVHTDEYLAKLVHSTLTAAEQRRIGVPWSPALWRRSLLAVQGTLNAARNALRKNRAAAELALQENVRLRKQLQLDTTTGLDQYGPVTARVSGSSPNVASHSISINVGTSDGVRPDMPVIAFAGDGGVQMTFQELAVAREQRAQDAVFLRLVAVQHTGAQMKAVAIHQQAVRDHVLHQHPAVRRADQRHRGVTGGARAPGRRSVR